VRLRASLWITGEVVTLGSFVILDSSTIRRIWGGSRPLSISAFSASSFAQEMANPRFSSRDCAAVSYTRLP
jgi:hypothetical protein